MLKHLLRSSAAELVDTLSVEWHTQKRGAGVSGGFGSLRERRQQRTTAALAKHGVQLIEWGDARLGR